MRKYPASTGKPCIATIITDGTKTKKKRNQTTNTKVTKITKPELIANIKKINPLIKGLTTKNKDELLEIYNKLKK